MRRPLNDAARRGEVLRSVLVLVVSAALLSLSVAAAGSDPLCSASTVAGYLGVGSNETSTVVVTVAGDGTDAYLNAEVGTLAKIGSVWFLAFDPYSGSLYFTDRSTAVRRLLSSGAVDTIVGNPTTVGNTDGVGSSALFRGPSGLALTDDSSAELRLLYVADAHSHTIRCVTLSTNAVTTIAGTSDTRGYVDAQDPTLARFDSPLGIAVHTTTVQEVHQDTMADGSVQTTTVTSTVRRLFVADSANMAIRVVALSSGGQVSTLGAATYSSPYSVAVDTVTDRLMVSDLGNGGLYSVSPTPTDHTADNPASAKSFVLVYEGVAGAATTPVVVDHTDGTSAVVGYLACATSVANRAMILSDGFMKVVVGTYSAGDVDGTPSAARLYNPTATAFDRKGRTLYIADRFNHRIRAVANALPSCATPTTTTTTTTPAPTPVPTVQPATAVGEEWPPTLAPALDTDPTGPTPVPSTTTGATTPTPVPPTPSPATLLPTASPVMADTQAPSAVGEERPPTPAPTIDTDPAAPTPAPTTTTAAIPADATTIVLATPVPAASTTSVTTSDAAMDSTTSDAATTTVATSKKTTTVAPATNPADATATTATTATTTTGKPTSGTTAAPVSTLPKTATPAPVSTHANGPSPSTTVLTTAGTPTTFAPKPTETTKPTTTAATASTAAVPSTPTATDTVVVATPAAPLTTPTEAGGLPPPLATAQPPAAPTTTTVLPPPRSSSTLAPFAAAMTTAAVPPTTTTRTAIRLRLSGDNWTASLAVDRVGVIEAVRADVAAAFFVAPSAVDVHSVTVGSLVIDASVDHSLEPSINTTLLVVAAAFTGTKQQYAGTDAPVMLEARATDSSNCDGGDSSRDSASNWRCGTACVVTVGVAMAAFVVIGAALVVAFVIVPRFRRTQEDEQQRRSQLRKDAALERQQSTTNPTSPSRARHSSKNADDVVNMWNPLQCDGGPRRRGSADPNAGLDAAAADAYSGEEDDCVSVIELFGDTNDAATDAPVSPGGTIRPYRDAADDVFSDDPPAHRRTTPAMAWSEATARLPPPSSGDNDDELAESGVLGAATHSRASAAGSARTAGPRRNRGTSATSDRRRRQRALQLARANSDVEWSSDHSSSFSASGGASNTSGMRVKVRINLGANTVVDI